MTKRNKKSIFKNTFRRHSNGVLYGIIILLATLITVGAIVMRNMEPSSVDETHTLVETTVKHTQEATKEKPTEETTVVETTTEETTTSAGKVRVTTETINIRNKPSEDGRLIAQAEVNDEFNIIAKMGSWYKIEYDGDEAYVSADLVEEID